MVLGCALVLGVAWAVCRRPSLVESFYSSTVGPLLGRALAAVSGLVEVSLAELFIYLALVVGVVRSARAAVHVARRLRRATNVLAGGVLVAAESAAVLLVLFTMLWGLNYARPDAVTRLHWEGAASPLAGLSAADELERLARTLVDSTNRAFHEAVHAADPGRPSELPVEVPALDAAIDGGFERAAGALGLGGGFAASRGPAKPVIVSAAMSHLVLAGVYFPFTGEANYNRSVPACELPHVVAHEKAHQRCIALEDEASFFGFLACAFSSDAFTRYSGFLFAQREILRELERLDPGRAAALVKERLPGVERDVKDSIDFWRRYRGVPSSIAETVNDRYLKLHGVEEGIASYGLAARLLVIFARTGASSAVISGGGPPRAPADPAR